MESGVIAGAFMALLLLLIVFLLLREVNNWYWKINQRIRLQEEGNQLLKKILAVLQDRKKE